MVGNFHYLMVGNFYYSVFFIVGTWAEAVDAAGQFRLSWKELVGLIVIIVIRIIKMIGMMEPGRPHDHEDIKKQWWWGWYRFHLAGAASRLKLSIIVLAVRACPAILFFTLVKISCCWRWRCQCEKVGLVIVDPAGAPSRGWIGGEREAAGGRTLNAWLWSSSACWAGGCCWCWGCGLWVVGCGCGAYWCWYWGCWWGWWWGSWCWYRGS